MADKLKMKEIFYTKIVFEGRVQGVGFRYKTHQIAQGFAVRGYVKNLTDGRVKLEVEGDENLVKTFSQNVSEHLADFIRNTKTETGYRQQTFFEFIIEG